MALTKVQNSTWVSGTAVASGAVVTSSIWDATGNYQTAISYQMVLGTALTTGLTMNVLAQVAGSTFGVPVIVASAGSGLSVGTYSDIIPVASGLTQLQCQFSGSAGASVTVYVQGWGISGI